jgi:hypothetical protein
MSLTFKLTNKEITMKLAEALLRRADMQKKLASLKSRIAENVKVQDGDTPSENPNELLCPICFQPLGGQRAKQGLIVALYVQIHHSKL